MPLQMGPAQGVGGELGEEEKGQQVAKGKVWKLLSHLCAPASFPQLRVRRVVPASA